MTRKTDPKVLIIGCDTVLLNSLESHFSKSFYKVQLARSVQEGITEFEKISPDLILFSLDCPENAPRPFFEKITEKSPETPIISISTKEKNALDSLELGAWDYITLPLDHYEVLTQAVQKVRQRGAKLQEALNYQNTLKEEVRKRTADLEQQNISLKKAEDNLKREIRTRQKIDLALRESEEILAHAQRISHLGKWVWDIKEDKLDWSDELYDIYKRPKAAGTSIQFWIESIHPDDQNPNEIAINEALTGKRAYNLDQRIICSDGEERIIHVEAELFARNEHQPERMIGVVQDITKQRAYEEELKKAKEMAESMNYSKNNFLKTMSHELRTPMHGVLGMAELTLLTNLDKKQRQYLETIYNASQAMTGILNDILDITKIEANSVELNITNFKLKKVVKTIIHLFSGSASTKNIDLTYTIQKEIPEFITGDPNRLNQVLSNLLGNAIKFTEEGSISLNVSIFKKEKETLYLQFDVIDTGIGIAEENLSYIFQKFTQEDSSSTRKYGGMGLGLSIVKNLVDLMEGEISIESLVNQGTKFTITLPMSTKQIQSASNTSTTESNYSGAVKSSPKPGAAILVVEDDRVNQQVLERMLNNLGYTADILPNGKAALTIITDFSYDAILMDCQMPVMDGFEATKEIRKMEAAGILRKRTPIIAITANAMTGDKEKCLAAEMDDYLSKPVRLASLEKLLNKYIGR